MSEPTGAGDATTPPRLHPVFLFAIIFSLIFLLHAPLLRLPYFWDEAGYYVPAARDLLLTGDPIPHSTLTVAHPPLVMAWLVLWWKLSGYAPAVTRTAMLLVAAFALLGVFRLAKSVASTQVALAATVCTALYPVFFAQSSMAHMDLAAAALGIWGIALFLEDRRAACTVAFCLAVLAKEVALIVPLSLAAWELIWWVLRRQGVRDTSFAPPRRPLPTSLALLLAPTITVAMWFAYHYHRTGFVFGNPEYFRYNVGATLHPARIALAFLRRLWQVTGYMNLFVLTLAAAVAMLLPPLHDRSADRPGSPRPRISLHAQTIFAIVIGAHVVFLSLVGGAVLARYLLAAIPLVIILCVSTLWRRVRQWPVVVAVVGLAFVLGLFLNPPYPFALEDNLAYRDYVLLHKRAASLVASRYSRAPVLTAWPATDELTKPYLGYSKIAVPVVPIENFSAPQMLLAARDTSQFDVALLFSTKYEPPRDLLRALPGWERLQARYFDYHRDLPPEVAARMLGGRIVWRDARRGQWIAVVEIERVQNVELLLPRINRATRWRFARN